MSDLQQAISTLLQTPLQVVGSESVAGGCISSARHVTVRHPDETVQSLFVKSNRLSFLENFEAESTGLELLSDASAIRVPKAIAVGSCGQQAWLVMEWVDPKRPAGDFFRRFAVALAELHRSTSGTRIGLDADNFIGATPQINTPCPNWAGFFAEQRIGYQLRRAVDQGLADSRLIEDVSEIAERMDHYLAGDDGTTCLLHGDLWSGNYLADEAGEPVLIDPAVYYGSREAEFGMLRLFGSCPAHFDAEYNEAFPLAGGWQRRVNVYVLYHLLNHLNLFGRGYHEQCSDLASKIRKA